MLLLVFTVHAVARVPTVASVPAVAGVPAVADGSADVHFIGLFYHVDYGMTIETI